MSQFLNRVRDVDPNDSDAVKEALTAFFQNLHKYKDVDCNRWLRALENVINRFPKYCGQHRVSIEKYLCHFLDSNIYYNVVEAAKCGHAIQQVRPQQERTASAKSCWRDQMAALCEAAHTLINSLFAKSANIYNRTGKTQISDVESLTAPLHVALATIDTISKSTDVVHKSTLLCTRLRNVLIFIQAMLVEIYPVAKPIRPQLILEVILHSLSASGNEDSSKVTTVKLQALKTLDAIVACLGSNLIPFSALVFRFVMQTLRWSSENATEETRKVRCAAYGSLTKWLNTLHVHRDAGDSARAWDSELTSHIVTDVTPHKHIIQLTPNAQPMKNLSKKARKKLANSMLMQSNLSSHGPGEKNKVTMSEESNDELAIAALECAEAFLLSCGIFLKPTIHKQFQELLVRECFALERWGSDRALWLLRALEAARKGVSCRVPPPASHCLRLYGALAAGAEPEISKFASQALLDIRLHLHCSPPSLNFALDEIPQNKSKEDKRKRLSERNRAALESLLGEDRMPSEDTAEEEVISIPDEPTSKRPRIEEGGDQISLSSESAASIEISDSSSVEELDDSADYIIEPNESMVRDLESQKDQQNIEDLSNIDDEENPIVEVDSTDGVIDNEDADTIELTQGDSVKSQENIYEAKTQMPHASIDSIEENLSQAKSPVSVEVAYDYPNTGQEKVTVLEKMDEDNLPSTNETDDVQITCGQTVNSQDEAKEQNGTPEINEIPKENGVEKSPERILENGDATEEINEIDGNIASKTVTSEVTVTVEDMLADFVDEVNEETQTQIPA